MRVEILQGEVDKGRVFPFAVAERVVIGRQPDCDVFIHDTLASRAHAAVECRDGVWFVRDLGSRNGTRLNGQPAGDAPLFNGDQVMVGSTVLQITDIPERPSVTSAGLRFRDVTQSVLVSMPHEEADMLRGRTGGQTLDDVLHENRILREVGRISQRIAQKGEVDGVLASVVDDVKAALAADTAGLLVRGGDGAWSVRAAAGKAAPDGSFNVSRTIIQSAVADGCALLVADPLADDRFDGSQSIVAQGVSSALCLPIKIGDAFDGVLFLDRRRRKAAFTSMDLRMAATVANIVGVFMEKERFEIESRRRARLAVIGEVVAGIAHNIKNIVTGFSLSVSNLETALTRGRTEMMKPCIRTIATLERRISDLMLNMLSYSKDRVLCPACIDIRPLVEDTVGPYRDTLAEKAIRFDVECPDAAAMVYAEDKALQRILLNLFLNAIDAIESRGKEGEKAIVLSVARTDEGESDLRLRDSGTGMSAETRAKLFTAFFSTKGSRGTGLGLAAVQKLVEEHHGRISVDSKEGEWTEFRIVLPAAPACAAASPAPSA